MISNKQLIKEISLFIQIFLFREVFTPIIPPIIEDITNKISLKSEITVIGELFKINEIKVIIKKKKNPFNPPIKYPFFL